MRPKIAGGAAEIRNWKANQPTPPWELYKYDCIPILRKVSISSQLLQLTGCSRSRFWWFGPSYFFFKISILNLFRDSCWHNMKWSALSSLCKNSAFPFPVLYHKCPHSSILQLAGRQQSYLPSTLMRYFMLRILSCSISEFSPKHLLWGSSWK